ncbi:onanonoxo-7-onima-8-eninoihtemlysoneda [Coprinopsis cinerea okayama7|uniref:Onanonoxo-7-onima-8-eninoihtemlysoneda n=1 Tax=Coprinopsis cinerea (strain Okayama-7 / 130 / ATCC MYA-4618 / FGSC 9003) TaxID=240176 RepID=A8NTF7_COPC7|nr:onanonoxo-7-onima-8-eninoihtemlysoneda [Coprinopsis cinerea okayama7\|eukprot:XP_001836218.2 onanonoxo-7-onima-8-eninoihtemlysoneda [Coprinopsis cinerea okayama7\
MSSLYKHLRIHQIFGANTEVGKTVLTTALARASTKKKFPVFYLKPVSTGAIEDADDHHIVRHGGKASNLIHSECLFRYDDPVSPHLAAKRKTSENNSLIPSDDALVGSIANRIREHAAKSSRPGHMYIETAGGVHSPTLSGTTQADAYRPLFLPTILVGDSKLGGISSTISGYESLLMRGFIVDAVVMFRDEYYRNWEYLTEYFKEKGVHVAAVDPPPPRHSDPAADRTATEEYYDAITSSNEENSISRLVDYLDARHAIRVQELESMPGRTLNSIWWPFVQHGTVRGKQDVTVIDSAYKDYFSVAQNKSDSPPSKSLLHPEFDGSASWWTQTLGHAHPALTMAAARASGRYGHVMFPQATHLPALKLAERLLTTGPGKGWASRVFFSDNGSTGMEVAIKMALRAWSIRNGAELTSQEKKHLGILGLKGSYHGDTIGAMDASEEGVYTCEWHEAKGYWFEPPKIGIQNSEVTITVPGSLSSSQKPHVTKAPSLSWVYNVEERINTPLGRAYAFQIRRVLDTLQEKGTKLAALVIEPLVLGAGGMIFVDPLFQRILVDTVRGRRSRSSSQWSGMPVIFDEVFTGLYRIGVPSAGPLLGVNPDISVNAKVLTGGLIPLSVTLASKSIFEAFLSDKKAEALLHGHSYTAHPIGCEVANETLIQIEKLAKSEEWKKAREKWAPAEGEESTVWSLWDPQFVTEISKLPSVNEVMALGSVLAIDFKDPAKGYTSFFAQNLLQPLKGPSEQKGNLSPAPGGAPYGVNYRTLGNVGYFMTSLNTTPAVIRSLEDRIWSVLSN